MTQDLDGCERQAVDGQTLTDVPAMSIVGSANYAQRTNNLSATGDPSPGSAGAGACHYPDFYNPDKPADPDDHPTGCDADEFGALTCLLIVGAHESDDARPAPPPVDVVTKLLGSRRRLSWTA